MRVHSFEQAIDWLYGYIPQETQNVFQGNAGLQRQQLLMEKLDNPQEKLKVIHIAGTSGKGSTSFLISTALISQGFKTGLHLSPHLLDIRERCLINNTYISEEKFVQYLNEIMPAVDQVEESEMGKPTYFEVLVGLSYYIMFHEQVDFAVVETGLGGLYDGTNVVHNPAKIAVITQIGLDHTQVLGDTYAKIAAQKAGIIQPGNTLITVEQEPSAQQVIQNTAAEKNAQSYILRPGYEFKNIAVTNEHTLFDFSFQDLQMQVSIGLLGEHQAQNAALALGSLVVASKQYSFEIKRDDLLQSLEHVHFLGRMDIRKVNGKTVILDGAHNPQKMESFLKALQTLFPDQKFHFLIAFKQGKDSEQMIDQIAPLASSITVTAFFIDRQDLPHMSQEPYELAEFIKNKNVDASITLTPKEGWEKALTAQENVIVVTGSLYLLSELYQHNITHSTDL